MNEHEYIICRQMRVKPAELSSRTTYWQHSESDDDSDSSVDEQSLNTVHSHKQNVSMIHSYQND